jgi:hypothetical protein
LPPVHQEHAAVCLIEFQHELEKVMALEKRLCLGATHYTKVSETI